MARIFFIGSLLLATSISAAYAQLVDTEKVAVIMPTQSFVSNNFTAPETIWSSPAWVLSAVRAKPTQNKTAILSQFDPLWQEKLTSGKFEQVDSIIIPGGIIDVVNNVVYLENTAGDIVVLDIKNGKTIRRINNICCPIATVDNALIALARTKNGAQSFYDLIILDPISGRSKTRAGPLTLPDWLQLPVDGERQKFIFSAHCYSDVLSVAWQASQKAVFPNPLSFIIPSMAQPTALQGNIAYDLRGQSIINQSMQDSDANFLGYLTADENLPAQVSLDRDTIAIRKYKYFLFSLVRAYPPENNISGAGIVAKRELQVKDMRNGKILWSHILPAAFMPIAF